MTQKQDLKASFRKFAKKNLNLFDKEKSRFLDKKITKILKCEYERLFLRKIPQIQKIQKIPQNLWNPQNPRKIQYKNPHKIPRKIPQNILVYLPMNLEADIFPFIFYLKKRRNVRIFTPFVLNDTFKIVPFRLPLRKNKYNICETFNSKFMNFNKIDLAIVPMLGMDTGFRRIGFGKGMYDRFYATLKRKPTNIFVSRILHYTNRDITDSYDIQGDIVITNCLKRGKYDFVDNSWILDYRNPRIRTNILYRQKNLHFKAKNSH